MGNSCGVASGKAQQSNTPVTEADCDTKRSSSNKRSSSSATTASIATAKPSQVRRNTSQELDDDAGRAGSPLQPSPTTRPDEALHSPSSPSRCTISERRTTAPPILCGPLPSSTSEAVVGFNGNRHEVRLLKRPEPLQSLNPFVPPPIPLCDSDNGANSTRNSNEGGPAADVAASRRRLSEVNNGGSAIVNSAEEWQGSDHKDGSGHSEGDNAPPLPIPPIDHFEYGDNNNQQLGGPLRGQGNFESFIGLIPATDMCEDPMSWLSDVRNADRRTFDGSGTRSMATLSTSPSFTRSTGVGGGGAHGDASGSTSRSSHPTAAPLLGLPVASNILVVNSNFPAEDTVSLSDGSLPSGSQPPPGQQQQQQQQNARSEGLSSSQGSGAGLDEAFLDPNQWGSLTLAERRKKAKQMVSKLKSEQQGAGEQGDESLCPNPLQFPQSGSSRSVKSGIGSFSPSIPSNQGSFQSQHQPHVSWRKGAMQLSSNSTGFSFVRPVSDATGGESTTGAGGSVRSTSPQKVVSFLQTPTHVVYLDSPPAPPAMLPPIGPSKV